MPDPLAAYPRTVQALQADKQYDHLTERMGLPVLGVLFLVFAGSILLVLFYWDLSPLVMPIGLTLVMSSLIALLLVANEFYGYQPQFVTLGLVDHYGQKHFGATRLYAYVAANLVRLEAQTQNLRVTGDDTVSQIIAGQIANLQKNVVNLLTQTEGIDGQAGTPFGSAFLRSIDDQIKIHAATLDRIKDALADYASAIQFDNGPARKLAMELVASRLGSAS
jgi:hypothetical protein